MRKRRSVKKYSVQFNPEHYKRVLERAIDVFGNRELAEEWLCRPCRYFNSESPSAIVADPAGLQTVEAYLQRIEYGVYH